MQVSQNTTSTLIYLRQLQNYIDTGESLQQIRRYLMEEMNNQSADKETVKDRLANAIVELLRKNLLAVERSEKQLRTVHIIEELLSYAEEAIIDVMNNQEFVESLINVATNKLFSFNPQVYSEVKLRICGIFKYFFDRYSTDYENHRRFIGGYQKLMKYGMQFPVNSTIVENTMYKGAKKVTDKGSYITKKDSNTPTKSDSFGSMPPKQTDSGSMKVILHEIEQTAASGERDLQKSIQLIATTDYVRMLKHKSKQLYGYSLKPESLTDEEKRLTKELYGRLRALLKAIDKYNETRVKQCTIQAEEAAYMQNKIGKISPDKKKKQSPCSHSPETKGEVKSNEKGNEENEEFGEYETPISNRINLFEDMVGSQELPKKDIFQMQQLIDLDFTKVQKVEPMSIYASLDLTETSPAKLSTKKLSLQPPQQTKSLKSGSSSPQSFNTDSKHVGGYLAANLHLTPTSSEEGVCVSNTPANKLWDRITNTIGQIGQLTGFGNRSNLEPEYPESPGRQDRSYRTPDKPNKAQTIVDNSGGVVADLLNISVPAVDYSKYLPAFPAFPTNEDQQIQSTKQQSAKKLFLLDSPDTHPNPPSNSSPQSTNLIDSSII